MPSGQRTAAAEETDPGCGASNMAHFGGDSLFAMLLASPFLLLLDPVAAFVVCLVAPLSLLPAGLSAGRREICLRGSHRSRLHCIPLGLRH